MNVKKLMIRDWVTHCNGTPMQVSCIKESCFACGRPYLYDYNNQFEPIPLTPEILEKIGWHHDTELNGWWHNDVEFFIFYTKRNWFYCSKITSINLYFVHELQQLLRLCGVSEYANNFKI